MDKKSIIMKVFLFFLLIVSLTLIAFPKKTANTDMEECFFSPDKQIKVNFTLKDGVPMYSVEFNSQKILNYSKLGFVLKDKEKYIELDKNFELVSKKIENIDNGKWAPVWGQQKEYKDEYTKIFVSLKQQNGKKAKMNIEFRVYNDGIGFRYEIPEQRGIKNIVITDEKTEFYMSKNYQSWWIPNDWDSGEYLYENTPISIAGDNDGNRYATKEPDVQTPFTMKTDKGTYISIHQAALYNYPGMSLLRDDKTSTKFKSYLCPWTDEHGDNTEIKFKGIDDNAKQLTTPWRSIQISKDLSGLVESGLILNLNEPNKIKDISWIKPMKFIGIWWELHVGKNDWGRQNNRHGATTENAKKYIDFAYDNLIKDGSNERIGFLAEGWNMGWDGNWTSNYNRFIFAENGEYSDYDLSEVSKYANSKRVYVVAHNETSGGVVNYEKQLDKAYGDYQRLNIPAIKSGYVADKGMKGSEPKGQHHNGQYMVNHYNNAVIKAADYKIMINTHEPICDTGISRTYPNWISREGVRGTEYDAWSEGNPPNHTTVLPFTRALSGPLDFTPGIFNTKMTNFRTVKTTRAKQLALYVVLYSPSPMISDLPENYLMKDKQGNPIKNEVLPEFKFLKDVAIDWDITKVLAGEIGEYTVIARKTKNKDEWFIGAITNEKERKIEISLDFLDNQNYTAEVYSDGPNADWNENPNPVKIYNIDVQKGSRYTIDLAKGGGQAIRLIPKN